MALAGDRNQAGVLLGYVRGLLAGNPMLAQLITAEGVERVELGTLRVAIEVHTNNYRSPRGRTVIAALAMRWRSGAARLRPIRARKPCAPCGRAWQHWRRIHC